MIAKYKNKKYVLKGKKCVLSDLKEKDLPKFVRWLPNNEVSQYLLVDFSNLTLKKEKAWYNDTKKQKDTIIFGLYALDGNKKVLIGSTGLKKIDYNHENAEFGIIVGDKNYWGKGIGTEATKLVLDFGFKVLGLNAIYLAVFSKNKAGQKAYKRAGFKKTGLLRQHLKYKKGFDDIFFMDILRKEWKK
jgi:RimJ/RimL family protein N-acetyltransferase